MKRNKIAVEFLFLIKSMWESIEKDAINKSTSMLPSKSLLEQFLDPLVTYFQMENLPPLFKIPYITRPL